MPVCFSNFGYRTRNWRSKAAPVPRIEVVKFRLEDRSRCTGEAIFHRIVHDGKSYAFEPRDGLTLALARLVPAVMCHHENVSKSEAKLDLTKQKNADTVMRQHIEDQRCLFFTQFCGFNIAMLSLSTDSWWQRR